MPPKKFPREEFYRRINIGWFRRTYGLETDSGSRYFWLRREKGYSDAEAQADVFKRFLETEQ